MKKSSSMQIILIIVSLSVFIMLPSACSKENPDPTDKPGVPITLEKSTHQMIASDNLFGLDLVRRVMISNSPDKNIILSPMSAALALAMTYNGASGETKAAMEKVLGKEGFSTEQINEGYKALMDGLKQVDPKITLALANSIWYRNEMELVKKFTDDNLRYFNAEVKEMDFSSPATKGVINQWCNAQTKGRIPYIIDVISPQSVMFLLNAIYFKGKWKYTFSKEDTRKANFYVAPGNTIQADMMTQTASLRLFSDNKVNVAELPYGNGAFAMLLVLPGEGQTTQGVISSLDTATLGHWQRNLVFQEVALQLPRFTFAFEDSLNGALTTMGMGIAFTPMADFSGMVEQIPLHISMVKQKAFVEVNEEGTEAAAVTVVEIIRTSLGPIPAPFIVDRPFLFFITEKSSGSLLFAGRVANPAVSE